ncbi:MAG: sulfotransferase [Actinomycetota bacterium]
MSSDKPRVLFITGYSRSGSTLLARVLGEIDGWVAPGELRYLWRRGLVENRRCDCGERCLDCSFWHEVLMRAFGSSPPPAVDDILEVQQRVDRVFKIPALARADGNLAAEVATYLRYHEQLYRTIADVSGSRCIVDSSKDPSFGHILALSDEIDLSVIHLVRDSRAVAHSWTREKHDPGTGNPMAQQHPLRSALEWGIADWAARRLTRQVGSSLTLRYEDLVAEPESEVKRILHMMGETEEPPLHGNEIRLDVGHAVSGNPMRFESGVVSIRNDDQWQEALGRWSRLMVTATTLSGLSTHGYLRENTP